MSQAAHRDASRTPGGWAWLKRIAPWALSLLVLGLLARQIHTIEWPEVWQALREQPLPGLALAGALALVSYALFAAYDLVGRHITGHRVSVPRTLAIAATCYAFNVNFGSLVGALAMKLRLYERAGLKAGTTARVIGLSIITNWLGYLMVGGAVLALAPPPLPAQLPIGEVGVRALGGLMVAAGAVYVLLCATGPQGGRVAVWRKHRMQLPDGRVALVQLALSATNWALMAVIVWVLLAQRVDYTTVIGVLLLAAIAGVITHVPAGLGVMEAVFVACLGGQLPKTELLAALLAYRATYYLMPLALALAAYALNQTRAPDPAQLAS
ncbi:MAG: lysylphosphatidylglycerol synthase domain-containing protein [Burkholderiales bacterium]